MITQLIGFTGMFLILFAFVMNQIHKWKDDYFIYDFFNFLGSSMLFFNAYMIKGWAFLGLNLVWALVSLRDLILYFQNKKPKTKSKPGKKVK